MKKILYGFLGLLFLIITSYIIWSRKDRITSINDIYPRYVLSEVESYGTDNGRGNLLALSPYVHTHDFSSEQAFYNMLEYYLSFAQRKKLLNDSQICSVCVHKHAERGNGPRVAQAHQPGRRISILILLDTKKRGVN